MGIAPISGIIDIMGFIMVFVIGIMAGIAIGFMILFLFCALTRKSWAYLPTSTKVNGLD
jgi:hypothetical protein